MISMKFLNHRESAEFTGVFSPKIVFPSLLATILNFCVKSKNLFISEMEQDRAISMKFLTCRLSAEYTGICSPKIVFFFSCKTIL